MSEFLKPRATAGLSPTPEPSRKAHESLLPTGGNQPVQRRIQTPMGIPSCWLLGAEPPPTLIPARQLGRLPGLRFTPGTQQTAPTRLGGRCACSFLPSPRGWLVLLWAAHSFLDLGLLPPYLPLLFSESKLGCAPASRGSQTEVCPRAPAA